MELWCLEVEATREVVRADEDGTDDEMEELRTSDVDAKDAAVNEELGGDPGVKEVRVGEKLRSVLGFEPS